MHTKISPPHHVKEEDSDTAGQTKNPFDVLPNELLSQILFYHLSPLWHVVCQSVCQQWRLILLNSMIQPTCPIDYLHDLARKGHLNVFNGEAKDPWDEWTCAFAALKGHLEVLQWAQSQGCPWNERTCAFAAQGGHLEVLQWAKSQGCPGAK